MKALRKIWTWIKVNWKVVLVSFVGIVLVVAYLLSKGNKDRIRKKLILDKRLSIIKDKKELYKLEGKREEVIKDIQRADKDIEDIDVDLEGINNNIDNHVHKIRKKEQFIKKLSFDEKLDRFNKMGF